jgi:hypothetical protein
VGHADRHVSNRRARKCRSPFYEPPIRAANTRRLGPGHLKDCLPSFLSKQPSDGFAVKLRCQAKKALCPGDLTAAASR